MVICLEVLRFPIRGGVGEQEDVVEQEHGAEKGYDVECVDRSMSAKRMES